MSWENVGTVTPTGDWSQGLFIRSKLLRFTYSGDAAWLEKFKVRAFIRLRCGGDGVNADWLTIWPDTNNKDLLMLSPIPIGLNTLEIKKRRDPYSINAPYDVIIEEYIDDDYLIPYPSGMVVGNGS